MGKKGKQRDFADLPDYEAEDPIAASSSSATAGQGAADDETSPAGKQQAGNAGGKKGGKKKNAKKAGKGGFDSDEDESTVLGGAGATLGQDQEEEEDAPVVAKQSKGKGKKQQQAKSAFELLEEDEDAGPAPAASDGEEEDEVPRAKPKKGGKKGGKGAPAGKPGFAALGLEDEEGEEAAAAEEEEEEPEQEPAPTTLVVAEIISAAPHPKATDKLKVCEVSVGKGRTYKVVTNALNAKRGMKVVFAPVGVTTATGIKVDQRTLKGVDSFGMLCQAADIGWTDVVDNKLVVMPDEAVVGEQPSDEPPEELDIPKRTSKAAAPAKQQADDEEEEAPVAKSSKKGKKGKKDVASLFAALEAAGDEGDEAPAPAAEPVEEEEQEPAPAAAGGKKKKKGAVNAAALFAALEEEGADALPVDEPAAEAEEAPTEGKKKKKKGGKDVESLFAALAGDGDGAVDVADTNGAAHAAEDGEAAAATEGKKKKKKGGKDVESLFEALAEGKEPEPAPAPAASSSAPAPAPAASSSNKKGGKGKVVDDELDALLAELDAPKPAAAAAAAGGGKKKKKGKGAAKEDEEDLDALLAAIDGPKAAAAPAPAAAAAAAAAPAAAAAAPEAKPEAAAEAGGDDDDDGDAGGEDLEALAASGKELTAAQKKKLKKKQKEKEKKAAAKAAEAGGDEAAPAPATKGGKPVKESAMGRKIREELERRQKAEEEARKAEEARREAELAEIKRMEEEEARKAEERRLKKEREKAKREELKRQGKLLTGKAKAEAERLAAMRAQLLKQAEEKGIDLGPATSMDSQAAADAKAVADAAEAAEAAAAAEKKPKKVVYMTKKQMQKKKEEEKSKEEEDAERARKEAEEEAARKAKEAEEAAAKAAAEAAAKEEEADDWEAAADDWEALDLDAVKAPITTPATPETTPAPEDTPATAAAAAKAEPAAAAKPAAPKAAEEPKKAAAKAEESDEEEEGDDEEEDGDEESEEASASGDSESASGSDSDSDADSDSEDESDSEDDSDSESESESEDDDSDSEDDSDDDYSMDSDDRREARIEAARAKRLARAAEARKRASKEELRSPVCCILGHVDVGKTKILDNIRRTNVQDGEAGGITQQIGATFVPGDAIDKRTESLRAGRDFAMKLPGLLVIDTPGHESFTNLRARGSGLCDIAVLIVDLMHGLEQQTIESINLLKMRKTPFIIALNKIDRLYGWKSTPDTPVRDSFKRQKEFVMTEFEQRSSQVFLQLNEQGLNVALYWKNPDPRKYVNIVPTSAVTGEGIPDLLQLMVKLTQTMMSDRLTFVDSTECTVLEVKNMEGLGTTVDCVLVNGKLREGDRIVVCGLGGPIVTRIKALKTPQVLREMRVKGQLMDHKEIRAAMGVKIVAPGLEHAVAGTSMYVVGPEDDEEELKDAVMEDMADIFSKVDKGGEGVCVQASTLGSLEALLTFLASDDVNIPVSGINIGPVHKKDVLRANVMNEKGAKKYAVILAFDVPVAKEAREQAEEFGVRIFTADIIYHLFDQFTAYVKQFKQAEQEAARFVAVFPCVLKILPTCIFNKKDPIVLGVEVTEGIAKVGTPLCVPGKEGIDLGRIASLELNHKAVDVARAGQSVAMKIEPTNPTEQSRMYGRHFDFSDELVSRITRESIDALKTYFKDEMTKDDWRLVIKLKKTFRID